MPTPTYYRTNVESPVTKTVSNILYPYIIDNKNEWYKKYNGFNSGMDIECDTVYSICPCKVTYIGTGESKTEQVVIVQYDTNISFRYSHLTSINVEVNDLLDIGNLVGTCKKYCKFEYLSSVQGDSLWVARVGQKQYYPQDPEDYVDGTITLLGNGMANPNDSDVDASIIPHWYNFPKETLDFYGDGY